MFFAPAKERAEGAGTVPVCTVQALTLAGTPAAPAIGESDWGGSGGSVGWNGAEGGEDLAHAGGGDSRSCQICHQILSLPHDAEWPYTDLFNSATTLERVQSQGKSLASQRHYPG